MATSQLATTIDTTVKRRLEKYCGKIGKKMNKFLEEAILLKLEDDMESQALTDAIRGAGEFETLSELKGRLRRLRKI